MKIKTALRNVQKAFTKSFYSLKWWALNLNWQNIIIGGFCVLLSIFTIFYNLSIGNFQEVKLDKYTIQFINSEWGVFCYSNHIPFYKDYLESRTEA